MEVVFYNGSFINERDVSISSNSRAFNYGDGFFETVKVINSKPFNFSLHMQRIKFAFGVLKLNNNYSIAFFKDKISYLISVNRIINGSIRIHISRNGIGRYLPKSNNTDLVISSSNGIAYEKNTAISICFYDEEYKTLGTLSNIKSSNSLVSVLASINAHENNFDNAILLNNLGNVIEAANANIFFVKNQNIYTPPIGDGCVDGTMRRLSCNELNIVEKSISKEEILDAEEVFVTNSSSGFTSVKNIEQTFFTCFNIANSLQQKLINSDLGL